MANFIQTKKKCIKEGKNAFMPLSELCVSLHQVSQLHALIYNETHARSLIKEKLQIIIHLRL